MSDFETVREALGEYHDEYHPAGPEPFAALDRIETEAERLQTALNSGLMYGENGVVWYERCQKANAEVERLRKERDAAIEGIKKLSAEVERLRRIEEAARAVPEGFSSTTWWKDLRAALGEEAE